MQKRLDIGIIYFSPTGNCKRIAMEIADFFHRDVRLFAVTIYDITTPDKREFCRVEEHELLFLVCPVYAQSLPKTVSSFIKSHKFKQDVVPCVVYGSVSAGRALHVCASKLQKSGARIIGGAEFSVAHHYIGAQNFPKKIKPAEGDYNADITKKILKLCDTCVARHSSNKVPIFSFDKKFNPMSVFAPRIRARICVKTPAVSLLCTKCSNCVRACPVGAIKSNLSIRTLKCERCGACVSACPHKARQLVLRGIMIKYLKKYHLRKKKNTVY